MKKILLFYCFVMLCGCSHTLYQCALDESEGKCRSELTAYQRSLASEAISSPSVYETWLRSDYGGEQTVYWRRKS